MELLSHYLSSTPQWVQPKTFQNRFELWAGEKMFASLEFPKWYGSLAVAISAEGCWTFKRVGFFNVHISIRKEGEENDLAIFHPQWTGAAGILEMVAGTCYTWKSANFWASQFAWLDSDMQEIMLYKPGVEDSNISDWFKTQARLEITPQAAGLHELSLLALLGWYLMVLKQQDDASASSST